MIKVGRDLTRKNNGRVIVVFEPHTYSRTKHLIAEFVDSFKGADKIIFSPVYSAREKPTEGYDSLKLSSDAKSSGLDVEYIESFFEIKKRILEISKPNDVVLILGAGTIEKLAKLFVL